MFYPPAIHVFRSIQPCFYLIKNTNAFTSSETIAPLMFTIILVSHVLF